MGEAGIGFNIRRGVEGEASFPSFRMGMEGAFTASLHPTDRSFVCKPIVSSPIPHLSILYKCR
ncbi:hypothetical protein HMPREF0973_00025 [Prevotella veroralis F0319]|uniref:Uncharacterized protein n=1 Tax=Prevotella veroralis F0319 TaxID=649761 RepID=C9MKA8_9BACT|nr:hypothetical protein HMPREF0973_00025 [Prevotella veroralis F0319]